MYFFNENEISISKYEFFLCETIYVKIKHKILYMKKNLTNKIIYVLLYFKN